MLKVDIEDTEKILKCGGLYRKDDKVIKSYKSIWYNRLLANTHVNIMFPLT